MHQITQSGSATGVDRRAFLRGAVFAVGGVSLGGPLLTACSGSSSTAAASGEAVALPTFVNALLAEPDLPGTPDGVQPGFLSAIEEYSTSVTGKVGSGGTVTALVTSYNPPPPPAEDNAWLQAVNEATSIEYVPQVTPAGDYPAKFASVTAGNDLPDLVQMPIGMNLPRLPDLLQSRFADLSDHLSGDAVKDYPNLAGIPTYAWKAARIRGRIFAVPLPRPVFASPLLMRQDLLDAAGLQQPTSTEEFEALCTELTDPKAGRWALGSDDVNAYDIGIFAQLFGAPMRWRAASDGSLVKDYETEEYASAVEFAAKLSKAGYFHPESSTVNISKMKEYFGSGKIVMYQDGPSGWRANYETYAPSTPGLHVEALVPFAAGGGDPVTFLDTGVFSLMGIKKADGERVEELLRLLNFFSAPYGSKEYLLLTAGVEGVDHTLVDGQPVPTDRGKLEQNISLFYLGGGLQVLVSAPYPDFVRQQHAWEEAVIDSGVSDPTNGVYSETNSRTGPALTTAMLDVVRGVVSGRTPLSAFAEGVKAWRSGGGDTIRGELETELAKSQ